MVVLATGFISSSDALGPSPLMNFGTGNCAVKFRDSAAGQTRHFGGCSFEFFSNPDLRTLPSELGNLRECWQLRLNKLNLPGIPKHVRPGTSTGAK